MDEIKKILSDQHALFDEKMGITVIRVPLIYEGFKLTKEVLQVIADRKTVLYLSGGKTPKGLYENLAQDQ